MCILPVAFVAFVVALVIYWFAMFSYRKKQAVKAAQRKAAEQAAFAAAHPAGVERTTDFSRPGLNRSPEV
jgi:Na+/H+ antiporter NhaC